MGSGAERMEGVSDLYPLISLQIGDAQSYLSRAHLFFALSSYRFLILVDNDSWRLNNNHSTTIHLRELFATKYRTSPFKNTRALTRRLSARYKDTSITSNDERKKLYRWASVVNSRRWRVTPFFSLMDLHGALHGFIVFEVSWDDIRGIDYLNILQVDTTMAFEVKAMRKWDFQTINQATTCLTSWFSGTPSETEALWRCLMFLDDKLPSKTPYTMNPSLNRPLLLEDQNQVQSPPDEDVEFFEVGKCNHHESGMRCSLESDKCLCNEPIDEQLFEFKFPNKRQLNQPGEIESMEYKDTLLKFHFNDRDLPFIFKDIITTDLRLLTLLESGLPSWVIFLQSYPLFCKVYRPWMRPLVRTLYITISLITCMIGFYDLYKNVPLMKAMVSNVCGPLFSWIENWDMVSRIQYIGTMLFLQNFEKAMRWSLKIGRVLKLSLLLVAKPLIEPLQDLVEYTLPLWVLLGQGAVKFYHLLSLALFFIFNVVFGLLRILFTPFMMLFKHLAPIAVVFRPFFLHVWALCRVPLQACCTLGNHAAHFCANLFKVTQGMLVVIASKLSVVARVGSRLSISNKPRTSDVSIWNAFRKELLSKVLRSIRSIMIGLVACLDAVARHRHSASTHLKEYLKRLSHRPSQQLEGAERSLSPEGPLKESKAKHEHVD